MLQCTIFGGRTKGANEKYFVFVHQYGGNVRTTYNCYEATDSEHRIKQKDNLIISIATQICSWNRDVLFLAKKTVDGRL